MNFRKYTALAVGVFIVLFSSANINHRNTGIDGLGFRIRF